MEVYSSLARRYRAGDLPLAEAVSIGATFLAHVQSGVYQRLAFRPDTLATARSLIARFDLPLRTLDALHVATVSLHGCTLVTADRHMATAARSVGVPVLLLAP